jgi:hypothetical protein
MPPIIAEKMELWDTSIVPVCVYPPEPVIV